MLCSYETSYLLAELPNTIRSCERHGVVAAWQAVLQLFQNHFPVGSILRASISAVVSEAGENAL